MSLEHKKVLVTGATGFIGSHLVQRLVQLGAEVRAMAHYRSDPSLHNLQYLDPEQLQVIEILKGDVEDPFFVRKCVSGCDVVFHLAALIGIPYSYVAPASYVSTNVQGTLNILEACRTEEVARLVHTSTSECYGTARYTPMDEQHPLQGQSPYSATKIAADKLAESYHASFGLPVVTVRPFNTYGPRQSTRAVIPTILSQVLTGQRSIRLGSLSPVRDLTYVTDTAEGFVRAALSDSAPGETINLGFGEGISIGNLASKIFELSGTHVDICQDSDRVRPEKSEVLALISDNSKARTVLQWQPRVSLEQGLEKTTQFLSDHLDKYPTQEYGV